MKLRPGNPEEAGMSSQRVRRVVDLAEGWVEQGVMPALVVLAARRGIIVVHEAFGRLRPEEDSPPLQLDTIFPLASLTKPITATLAMILVEDGLLGLNRPVQWYIPEFVGEGKDKVMVHHLLTHTAGMNDELEHEHAAKKKDENPPPDEAQHLSLDEHMLHMYDAPLWKPPGVEMKYSNHGIILAGEIVERVSSMSLEDFARERIFDPLGMKDTFYEVPGSVEHRIAADASDTQLDVHRSRGTRACGGAHSTAMDMAIFGQMFLNRGVYGDARILSPASVAEMTRNQIPGIGARYGDEFFPEASWGFCWNIHGNKKDRGTLHSPETFCHGGGGRVFLWADPVYEIVGVYFSVMLEDSRNYSDLFMNAVTAAVVDV